MACSIITSNCCSLDTLTLILFKPLGNKCFKSTPFQTLEVVGAVRSLRKRKGKVFSTQKELNNPFKISVYVDRQHLMPTFLTLALYVDWFFFFLQHSLTRWIFATADQQRVSDLSECTRLEQAELLSNSLLPPSPFSRSLPPSDNSPPALRPLHVIPKEQNKEEKKKRRASNREPEPRKKAEEDRREGKEKDGQLQNAAIAEIFQRHWLGSVSSSVGRDFSTGGTGQHLGGTSGQPAATARTPSAASATEAAENPALYQRGKVSPTHSHAQAVRLYYAANPLLVSLTCTCF